MWRGVGKELEQWTFGLPVSSEPSMSGRRGRWVCGGTAGPRGSLPSGAADLGLGGYKSHIANTGNTTAPAERGGVLDCV